MSTKICSTCKEEKPLEDFYVSRTIKSGRQSSCKPCQRQRRQDDRLTGRSAERQRRHYRKNRQAKIAAQVQKVRQRKVTLVLEAGGACQRCGYKTSLAALGFHHRDPATKCFEIGTKLSSYGLARLRAEVKKCDLLCANCHMEVEHGEVTGEHIA